MPGGGADDCASDIILSFILKEANETSRTWGLSESHVWGTEVQKLLFVDDVVKNVTSDLPTCLVLPVHNFSSLCRQKKKIKTKHSSSVSPLNENSLLQQKMYGCCCWCGRWDFTHHSKPWLKYVNSVSLIAVKHQREAWKISVIFDPLPILQQMALQQHSVAWAAGPIRAAKTA